MNTKSVALLLTISLLSTLGYSQFWLQSAGGLTVEEAYDVAVDGQNNAVTVGYFTGTASFGGNNITSAGATDMFIAKTNANGVVQWAHSAGGSGNDRALSVKTDAQGNNYVVGFYSGTATFGATSITAAGLQDIFVAKYNASGVFQWVTSAGGINNEFCSGVALSPSGDIYITGAFRGSATFGALTATGHPTTTDVFTAKLSSTGVFSWVEVGTGAYNNYGVDVGTDNNGNVFVTGMFSDTITFDNQHNNNTQNTIFLVKYNSQGTEQWFKQIGGGASNVVTRLKTDNVGNSYLTGDFSGSVTFFGVGGGANVVLSTPYLQGVFVGKVSTSGATTFASSLGSNNLIESNGIAIDATGEIAIGGKFECGLGEAQSTAGAGVFQAINGADMFVSTFSSSGNLNLVRHLGGQGNNEVFGVGLTSTGSVLAVGSYTDELIVPTSTNFNATNLALFNGHSYPANNGFCMDASYGEFHGTTAAGNKDVFIGNAFDPLRAPLDFFMRSGTGCVRDVNPICFDSLCSSSLTGCDVILVADNFTLNGIRPNFFYAWSPNAQATSIPIDSMASAPTSGTYVVTVTSADSCFSVIDSINVTVLPSPTNLLVSDSKGFNNLDAQPITIELCNTDTVTITGFGAQSFGTYMWTGPGLPTAGLTDSVFVTNLPGTYTYTVMTPAGCTLNVEVDVEIVMPLDPWGLKFVVADSHEICEGDFVIPYLVDTIANPTEASMCLSDSGFTITTTFSVSPGIPASNGCETYVSMAPDTTNWYTITATVVRENVCGADTTVVTKDIYVLVHPSPVIPPFSITITGNPILCPGASTDLTATGGANYQWFGPGIQFDTNATITVVSSGVFGVASTISDTNAFGCTASQVATATVTVVDKPQPSITATDILICPNDSVGLACSEITGLNWFGPSGPLGGNNPIYVTDPGSYYCVVNDMDSCNLVSNTLVISQYTTPYLQALGDSILCPGDSTVISAQTGGNAVIEWQAPLSGNNPNQTIHSPGVYTCKITACGIESYASITIYSPALLAQFTVSGPLCPDSFVTLTADTGLASYLWSPTGETTPSITVSAAGSYSLFVTEPNGCSGNSDTVTIQPVNINASIVAQSSVFCPGDSVALSALPTGGTYQWIGINATDSSVWVNSAGAYAVMVTDSNGCKDQSAPFTVAQQDTSAEIFVNGDTLICSDDSVRLSTVPFNNAQYLWLPTQDTTPEIWVSAAGNYSVQLVDDDGCDRFAGPVSISVEQNNLQAPVVANDTVICFGKRADLWASATQGNIYWYRLPEDSLVNVGANYNPLAGLSTTYMVRVESEVCASEAVSVTVEGYDCYGVFAPNIFTPNGDGSNDYFQVYVKEPTCYYLEIYNRWGNLVYTIENANWYWDGTMQTTGKDLSDGVYFWILDYCDIDETPHTEKGTVTLSRGE